MPAEYKDYYKILGVERSASEDAIRKAFRALARKHHPDVAKNKAAAEEKFKEINEAYEVLGDPDKRKKYDTLGADWQAGAGFRPPPGAGPQGRWRQKAGGPGGDVRFEFGGTGFSDFFEQVFGSMRSGGGFSGGETFERTDSVGRGRDTEADLMVTLEEAARGSLRPITVQRPANCPQCRGAGVHAGRVCGDCRGSGQVRRSQRCQVKIPVGVRAEQRLRLAGLGESGAGDGPAGDLYLRVRFARHPDFEVDGENLVHGLELAPWEAVLGANVAVPTLDGRVNIKIPPGTQSGQQLRVRGQGLASVGSAKGDLIVRVTVATPPRVTEEERELWERLAAKSKFRPRE